MNTGERVRAERRLAAILAADVVGYSRLIGVDEEGTLSRLRSIRAEVIDSKIAAHHGRLVKTSGDGLLVEFGSVVDALRCATEVQQAMARRNSSVAVPERIEFRIGINVGDVVVENGDIFGDGVNVAARLEGLAEPGGICVSARVQEDVAGRLDLTFDDLGEQSVKNISRPIRAYALSADVLAAMPSIEIPVAPRPTPPAAPRDLRRSIAAAVLASILIVVGGAWWLWSSPNTPWGSATAPPLGKAAALAEPSTLPRLSIVVLPLVNLSNDPEQEYFADAITDDLTTDLSRIPGSFVIARTTAFTYKGKSVDVKQIGRDLGVHYVLEGSVRRLGDRVQVNVQLIDTKTDSHVWVDHFDTDRSDLVQAQSEITSRLARTLGTELLRNARRRIEQDPAANPDARDLVMRARALNRQSTSAAVHREALNLLQQALTLDPMSVDARLLTAEILVDDISNGNSNSTDEDKTRADKLIREALEQEPNSAQAHATKGLLRRIQGQGDESQVEWETAIALDPNNAWIVRQFGQTMLFQGKPETALPYLEKAIRLDPRSPFIFVTYSALARCHLFLGQTEEGIALLRKARALGPDSWFVHLYLAGALGLSGDVEDAKNEIAEAAKLRPNANSIAGWRAIQISQQGLGNPQYQAFQDKTIFAGLRRAGFPEE
jgi:adenylate cyclase